MRTRRTIITVIAAMPLLALCQPGRAAWGQTVPQAVALIQKTSDQLVGIVNATGSPDDKRRRLQEVLDTSVDIEEVARFCLGRFWQSATPDQRQQYLARFRDLLVAEIAGHLGEYRGVEVTMGPTRPSAATQIVTTTVARPGNPTKQVDWVVSMSTGNPKIVDLLAGGTSMRLTHSADFTAYLARHRYDVHELIQAMNVQVSQNR
jgi:phospholipid transport system substrate-binding protein